GQSTTVRIGGDASVLNIGRLYVGQAQAGSDAYNALPGNSAFVGVSDDRFEQQAGTVLTGSLYFNTSAAATNTMLSTYTLGTSTSSAILSAYQIQIGGSNQAATLSAKSRATINFVNGRLEAFDGSRAPVDSPFFIVGQPGSGSDPTSIVRGLPGGGAVNDYRTLNIALADTGTHTFAAGAGKTLSVESTALITGAGGLSIEGPGTVMFAGANTYAGTTTIQPGAIGDAGANLFLMPAAQNIVFNGGGADIRGGRLILYAGSDVAAVLSQVRGLLAAGYVSGFATGPLRSSTATAARGLGYGDIAGGGNVTVQATLYGDANLDGGVDFNDFLALQNAFGLTTGGWMGGDFNYDGVTDFNDFLALQNNFGQSSTGAAAPVTAAQVSAMQAFAAAVPEPVSGMVAAAAMFGLGRRRQRVAG
ncbi:MAG: sorting protein, partial [Phycisphaerales bacterium]|nr:sorting protein [Phycisphaerales bacterium]